MCLAVDSNNKSDYSGNNLGTDQQACKLPSFTISWASFNCRSCFNTHKHPAVQLLHCLACAILASVQSAGKHCAVDILYKGILVSICSFDHGGLDAYGGFL